jgi:hypothetical protein
MIVVGLVVREDFAKVVNLLLYLVDVPGLLPLYYQGSANNLGVGRDI